MGEGDVGWTEAPGLGSWVFREKEPCSDSNRVEALPPREEKALPSPAVEPLAHATAIQLGVPKVLDRGSFGCYDLTVTRVCTTSGEIPELSKVGSLRPNMVARTGSSLGRLATGTWI